MSEISVIKADITKIKVDATVNAANTSLLGGGGVDGAIHRAGGKAILEDCIKIRNSRGGCKVGEAVITTAGNLPSKYVIHTVGPKWNGGTGSEARLLQSSYTNSLKLASEKGLVSIAFPNISTGIYGYPKLDAARIAVAAVRDFLSSTSSIEKVIFVCFDDENLQLYQKQLELDSEN